MTHPVAMQRWRRARGATANGSFVNACPPAIGTTVGDAPPPPRDISTSSFSPKQLQIRSHPHYWWQKTHSHMAGLDEDEKHTGAVCHASVRGKRPCCALHSGPSHRPHAMSPNDRK